MDNTAAIASIALHDRVTGGDHGALLRSCADAIRSRYVDPASGLLVQAVSPNDGQATDRPRASGTALASYFLSFSHPDLSRDLYEALLRSCREERLGFGMIREYPRGTATGRSDVDSGPVVLGISFSGTGFALAPHRIHGDRDAFRAGYRLVHLMGAPIPRSGPDRTEYVSGGPLGNAIILAMLTAGSAR